MNRQTQTFLAALLLLGSLSMPSRALHAQEVDTVSQADEAPVTLTDFPSDDVQSDGQVDTDAVDAGAPILPVPVADQPARPSVPALPALGTRRSPDYTGVKNAFVQGRLG